MGEAAWSATALDPSLKSGNDEEISSAFKDMGVVQRRAMRKADRFLFATYMTLDFSDGPYTNYSVHLNPGYAFSDFFEVYFNFSPFYLVSPRRIVELVDSLGPQAVDGREPSINAAKPKFQYGIELLWAPLYGKDSLGVDRIIRSDTFLKFSASQITYDVGSGLRFVAGAGKTFFLSKSLGLRFCLDLGLIQTIITTNDVASKAFQTMFLTELGTVFYF